MATIQTIAVKKGGSLAVINASDLPSWKAQGWAEAASDPKPAPEPAPKAESQPRPAPEPKPEAPKAPKARRKA